MAFISDTEKENIKRMANAHNMLSFVQEWRGTPGKITFFYKKKTALGWWAVCAHTSCCADLCEVGAIYAPIRFDCQ